MTATVTTISPRVPVGELERRTWARVDRDGVAVLAAATGDQRQLRHLRRLTRRLAGDDRLDCFRAEYSYIDEVVEVIDADGEVVEVLDPDGEVVEATVLTVFLRSERGSRRGLGWFGEARTG